MSVVSKAEVALNNSLQKSRSKFVTNRGKSSTSVAHGSSSLNENGVGPETLPAPPIPVAISEMEEELRNVLTLEVPRYDKTKTFHSLEIQKISKKDRHMTALDNFSNFLDKLSEDIEQNLLERSRAIREELEEIDTRLQQWYKTLVDETFLVKHSEEEISGMRRDIQSILHSRSAALTAFATNLEQLEAGRADTVSKEIKLLLDRLIAIAFQLPNEIEYTVETEAFELNAVVTSNRKNHAALLGIMRTAQVEVEVEALHRWEQAKKLWRVLRHRQALSQYHEHMSSTLYTDPADRQELMKDIRSDQVSRHRRRNGLLDSLAVLRADDIASAKVLDVQRELVSLHEEEMLAMQKCYDGLSDLKDRLQQRAEKRREELRLELHEYGALEDEPPMKLYAQQFQAALADESLSELWRLGGGLKPEFISLSADMASDDIIYDVHTSQILSRLELIVCSFRLKDILNERGRLMRLDPIRSMIVKMRSVSRADVIGVIRDILPDLEEILAVERVPELFRHTVREISDEMKKETQRVLEYMKSCDDNKNSENRSRSNSAVLRGVTALKAISTKVKTANSTSDGRNKTRGGTARTGTAVEAEFDKNSVISPVSVKLWVKQLGILYFGSDLPQDYMNSCSAALEGARKQLRCNELVDEVVQSECERVIKKIDKKYKKLIEQIANCLETQVSMLNTCCTNICELFNNIALAVEAHRKAQIDLDEKAADVLWDYAEDYRLLREDLEAAYESACTVLKESANYDSLNANFEKVLQTLLDIQESYRTYHEKACYLADMHPVEITTEFKNHLESICHFFTLNPIPPHPILQSQSRIWKTARRLNKKYFVDSDAKEQQMPNSASIEVDDDATVPETVANLEESFDGGVYTSPLYENPNEIVTKGAVVGYTSTKIGGKFGIKVPMSQFVEKLFSDESALDDRQKRLQLVAAAENADKEALAKAEESAALLNPAVEQPVEELPGKKPVKLSAAEIAAQKAATEAAEASRLAALAALPKVLDAYPWILQEGRDIVPNPPLPSVEIFASLDPMDRCDLEDLIAEYFVYPVGGANHPMLLADPALNELYRRCVAAKKQSVSRSQSATDPEFILKNLPVDVNNRPWLEMIEVYQDGMVKVITTLRGSLVTHLENEAYFKTVTMDQLNQARKTQLTEELEDRLRTHWPRRGRVETQLKQPREAELLSHEEKTYRIIQSIQEKMMDVLSNFQDKLKRGNEAVDTYITDMAELMATLRNTTYKTLASLQGVDVKGRSTSLAFQNDCMGHLATLNKILNDEVNATIANAQDFRKLCPLQQKGADGILSNGYSQEEINRIQLFVDGQEQEIREIAADWNRAIAELQKRQESAIKEQEEFSSLYGTIAQELALSEGLGQRYGAPRRRAQERLRTETSRDEQNACKVDDMLAKLEFALSESTKKYDAEESGTGVTSEASNDFNISSNGRKEVDRECDVWEIFMQLRTSLDRRAAYLAVFGDSSKSECLTIPWVARNCIPNDAPIASKSRAISPKSTGSNVSSNVLNEVPASALIFSAVVDEAEVDCKKETVQLYDSEGRGASIKSLPGGVPESLNAWLQETRQKLLGPGGYRERAWKRLWGQVDLLDTLLARKPGPGLDSPEPRLGLPGMSLRGFQTGYYCYVEAEKMDKENKFSRTLAVLEKCRDKHDRLLRPRLGSPDAVGELNSLNSIECQRSNDLTTAVLKFRSTLVKKLCVIAKEFTESVCTISSSYMTALDTTLRLDIVQIPPDTEVPKKRMTLKKLRKAERIQNSVIAGAEDVSKSRVWPSISVDRVAAVLRSVDDLILEEDRDAVVIPAEPAAVETKGKAGTSKKTDPKAAAVVEASFPESNPSSIVPDLWIKQVSDLSAKRGLVSSAHRLLISERDAAVEQFFSNMVVLFNEIRAKNDLVLQQEKSWSERWERQVEMLRKGVA